MQLSPRVGWGLPVRPELVEACPKSKEPHTNGLRQLPSASVRCREARLAELVRIEHETDQRAARAFVRVDLVDLERVHGEDVAMRLLALGRARPAVAGFAEVGPGLNRAPRCLAACRIADAEVQRRDVGGYVEHHPMPPAAA